MIRGHCRTNLDEYSREQWPSVFAGVPQRGDAVKSKDGAVLYVCRVTHSEIDESYESKRQVPHISVELHTFKSSL